MIFNVNITLLLGLKLLFQKLTSFEDEIEEPIGKPRKKFDFDEEESRRRLNDDLEKYRPHNYEAPRSVESSDINDLRDYYSQIGTKQRALRRYNLISGKADNEEDHLNVPYRKTSLPSYNRG